MQKLLLHICCGPCATSVIERLSPEYNITGYFFNPNIHPEEEYRRRLDAAQTAVRQAEIPCIEGEYEPEMFMQAVRGFENEPENGTRCPVCYRLRLAETARYAALHSLDCIASTLTLGPQKKASVINPIGRETAAAAGLSFVDGDWKKKDGFKRSLELCREIGLYRQHYCGCLFSMSKSNRC